MLDGPMSDELAAIFGDSAPRRPDYTPDKVDRQNLDDKQRD